jgi:formate/nitrite transporter FocA (FNT family)
MIKSIMGGFMITVAAAIYLTVGGALGAFMFAIGLLTILFFQFDLFTGKAGLLAQKCIRPKRLLIIWIGNLIGCILCSLLLLATPLGPSLAVGASAITLTRISNLWFENIILGIFCGILMYIGVK